MTSATEIVQVPGDTREMATWITSPGATTPTFAAKQDFTAGTGPVSVAIGDLNGDGKPDLAVVNESVLVSSGAVSVLLNTTTPGATTSPAPTSQTPQASPTASPARRNGSDGSPSGDEVERPIRAAPGTGGPSAGQTPTAVVRPISRQPATNNEPQRANEGG